MLGFEGASDSAIAVDNKTIVEYSVKFNKTKGKRVVTNMAEAKTSRVRRENQRLFEGIFGGSTGKVRPTGSRGRAGARDGTSAAAGRSRSSSTRAPCTSSSPPPRRR